MRSDGSVFLDRIGRRSLERLLMAGTAAVVLAGACIFALGRPPQNRADLHMALNADGSAEAQLRLSWICSGPAPIQETSFSGSVPREDDRWTDGTGRLLETTSEPREGGGNHTRVQFAGPLFPGERAELRESFKVASGVVQRDGDDYLFKDRLMLGGAKATAVSFTVTLPEGATAVSTQPGTKWRCVDNMRNVLHFEWIETAGNYPELQVKYSLPKR